MKKTIALMTMLAMVGLLASVAQAATVGYWRFEDTPGYLEDSSTYNNDLTAAGDPTHDTLSNLGVSFDNPIPQTSAANAKAVSLDRIGDYYHCADQTEFTVTAFTIEAYVRWSGGNTGYVASHYDYANNDRSWGLYFDRGSNTMRAVFSSNGTSSTTIASGISVAGATDYFVAMSFDVSGNVEFYLKNLSAGTWNTATVSHSLTSLNDTDGNFDIGAIGNGHADTLWHGVIDEVRFSNDVLGQDDMLAMPEPATMTLLLLGLPLALRRRRK
ncbi:MAG: LamG domain-containing protein [Phycisphaerae bacterium]|nr:LamG domain-containing protein [Phycisphaerae bacterium]